MEKENDINKALFEAIDEGNVEAVKSAIAAGADVNAKDEDGCTPLHGCRDADIAKALIDAGADVIAEIKNLTNNIETERSKLRSDLYNYWDLMSTGGLSILCNQIKELMKDQGRDRVMACSADSDDEEYDYIFFDDYDDYDDFIADYGYEMDLAGTYDYTLRLGGLILEDDHLNGYFIILHETDDGEFLDDEYSIEDIDQLMETMKYRKFAIFMQEHIRTTFDPYKVLKFYIALLENSTK